MSDDTDHSEGGHEAHDHEDAHLSGHAEAHEGRITSPMQDFETSQVGIGFAVMVLGVALTIAVPLLLV